MNFVHVVDVDATPKVGDVLADRVVEWLVASDPQRCVARRSALGARSTRGGHWRAEERARFAAGSTAAGSAPTIEATMSRRSLVPALLVTSLSIALAGCSADSGGASPTSTEPSWNEVIDACTKGTPIPQAAAYGGSLHSAIFATEYDPTDWTPGWFVSAGPLQPDQSSALVQLIICRSIAKQTVHTCGVYTRTDGVAGDVYLTQETDTIAIVIAQTGKTLESKLFTGAEPDPSDCPSDYSIAPKGSPPWHAGSGSIDLQPEIDYVLAVATRPAP